MVKISSIVAISFMLLSTTVSAKSADERIGTQCGLERPSVAGFVRATRLPSTTPGYPGLPTEGGSEAWVLLEFAVSKEGTPHKVTVADAFGTVEFVKAAVRALSNFRHRPAERNGQVVDQFLTHYDILFRFSDRSTRSDSDYFANRYKSARRMLDEKNPDGAIRMLQEAFGTRLNLYEVAMGSALLGIAYARKGMWESAQIHMRHAMIEDGTFLEEKFLPSVLAVKTSIDAVAGDLEAAVCAFRKLEKIDPNAREKFKAAAKAAADAEATLDSIEPIVTHTVLILRPILGETAMWRRYLYRSKFRFDELKGDVKSFHLRCVAAEIEGAVDTKTQWTTPPGSGACVLQVTGAPGASFKLVEER